MGQWDNETKGQRDNGTMGQWDNMRIGQWENRTMWEDGTMGQPKDIGKKRQMDNGTMGQRDKEIKRQSDKATKGL